MITGRQIRMARAALKWKVDDLAGKTDTSWARLQKSEKVNGETSLSEEARADIRRVFEEAGVIFLNGTDDCEPGVTVRKVPT